MISFAEYSKSLFEKLIADGFEPIRGLGGSIISNETPVLGLVNFTGSMWSAVIIINANTMSREVYENNLKPKLDGYFEELLKDYGKKNVVVVNIFVDNSLLEYNSFLDEDRFELDRVVMNTYWGVDLRDRSLKIGKNSPDRIGNLKRLAMEASDAPHDVKTHFDLNMLYDEAVAKRPRLAEKGGAVPIATYALIIINLLIGVATLAGGNQIFALAMTIGALFPQFVLEGGEHYRLFTYMFLHANTMHLLNNCFSLYIFGTRVERFYGRAKILIIYLASGILAGLVSVLMIPNPTIGASGATFGLLGAILALAIRSKADIVGLNYSTILVLASISLALGFTRPEVNNHAHIGGFVAGFVLGMLFIWTGDIGKKDDSVEN